MGRPGCLGIVSLHSHEMALSSLHATLDSRIVLAVSIVVIWGSLIIYVCTGKSLPSVQYYVTQAGECFPRYLFCNRSPPFSYFMESLPTIARTWTPCHNLLNADDHAREDTERDFFEVNVYAKGGEVIARVVHHSQKACFVPGARDLVSMGLSETDVATDYVEVLVAGPQRRLQRMEYVATINTNTSAADGRVSCLYTLRYPIYVSGEYRIQILVVHSNITLESHDPYQHFILWDHVHNLTSALPGPDMVHQRNGNVLHDPGIWSMTKDLNYAQNQYNFGPDSWLEPSVHAYRCPSNGTLSFEWTLSHPQNSSHDYRYGLTEKALAASSGTIAEEEAMGCLRKLSPQYGKPHPKIVLFGDSMMRQTFDSFSIAIGMKNVKAVKEFKSLMDSQNWGGEELGVDLCFQWSARHNEGRERCKLGNRIHVL